MKQSSTQVDSRLPTPLLVLILLAVLILLGGLGVLLFIRDEYQQFVLINAIYLLLNLWAVISLFYAASRSGAYMRRMALAWGFIASAYLCAGISNGIWVWLNAQQGFVAFPSLADVVFLGIYPLFLGGVLLLPAKRLTVSEWLATALDMTIVMIAAGLLYWHYLVAPTATVVSNQNLFIQLLALGPPVGDLLLLWGLLVLLYQRTSLQHVGPLFVLAGALVLAIVADSLYAMRAILGTYDSGGLLNITWVLASLLYGTAGLWQAHSAGSPMPTPASNQVVSTRAHHWLPYIPYGWALGAYLLLEISTNSNISWLSITLGVIIGLVLLRQMITSFENRRLFAQTQEALEQVQRQAEILKQTNQALQVEILERQQAEVALHNTHERYRRAIMAIDAVPYEQDYRTESFVFMGEAIQEITGYTASEMTPALVDEISLETIMKGDSEGLNEREAIRRTRLGEFHRWRCDTRILTRSGEERWIMDTSVEIHDEQGQSTGSIGILIDITEQKQAEADLVKQKEMLQTIFDHIPMMIDVIDKQGQVKLVNRAWEQTLGWSLAEVQQQNLNIVALCYPDPVDRQRALQFIAAATSEWIDLKTRVRDNRVLDTRWAIIALSDGTNLSIGQDITARKMLEEQFRQTQKMEAVGQLTGGIAHDFNNLLTVINGYSDLALRRLPETNPLRHKLEEIKKAGERAAALTSQLLAFSRKQVLQPQVLDLNRIVAEMEKLLLRLIGENIELRTRLAPTLKQIKADPGQMEQVLMNLIVNARDAMPQGGKLTIETQQIYLGPDYARQHLAVNEGPYVLLAVSDTGIGMDEATQAHIFEPFYTTKEVGKGTGLGLSTVYGIVKQSSGHIWVYSEVGRGTTFKIYLPCLAEDVCINPHKEETETSLHGTETIVLVEDEETVRNLAREVLTMYGYHILEAANGSAALALCAQYQEPIHLLISDVIMPELSGSALVEQLAQVRPELKVLYMSGYTDNAIIHQGVLDQEANFIQKPFTPLALTHKVRLILDS